MVYTLLYTILHMFSHENYQLIQTKINTYSPSCSLVTVAKYQSLEDTQAAIDAGIIHIAESKVQQAEKKKTQLTGDFSYHLIGHLQSSKAKAAIDLFDMIQSVDSIKLATKLHWYAEQCDKKLPILLQCNLTSEQQKYGFLASEVALAIETISSLSHLDLQGLMCMGKQGDKTITGQIFRQLRTLCDQYELPVCSMGMSHDRQIALEEWSTMLRIGSFLFDR